MKFGEIPTSEAEGSILAHTQRLPRHAGERSGTILKKGLVLTDADLAALTRAGVQRVWAATLEPGDIAENEAAARLATAVLGPGIRPATASTGRVNLYATTPGILVTDSQRVDAVNTIDSRLTMATLVPYRAVQSGELVATVKVIPFAVPQSILERAVETAAHHRPVTQIAPFHPQRVALILTTLSGVASTQLSRAEAAQAERVVRVRGQLNWTLRVPHDIGAVAQALRQVLEAGADMVLVLGASAMVDVEDVIPAAIVRVGGHVSQVGMPVDPGNLLVLGSMNERPIVGVPGCARSARRSGFDAVLERLSARIPLGSETIQRMGAGGLLSEIPSRPRPRERGRAQRAGQVAGVVLAAGRSTRMGERNKLLEKIDGVAMVTRVVDALLATRLDPVTVVTGFESERVRRAIRDRPVEVVDNPTYADGQSSSIGAGIRALASGLDGALIALGDMPLVRSEHMELLVDAFESRGCEGIYVPVSEGCRGNPVLFGAEYFAELASLSGDVGGKALLRTHAEAVVEVAIEDDGIHIDVDTPEALTALLSRACLEEG